MLDRSNLDVGWTDERIETVKRMWVDGYSDKQIAAEIGGGLSRNAVIGMRRRLGLPPRRLTSPFRGRSSTAKPKRRNPVSYRAIGNAALKLESAPDAVCDLPADESPCAVTILNLTAETCRWPLGEPTAAMLYCGAEPFPGYSYCARHCRMAYRVPENAA